mmetsp:Transcript_16106/g.15504  ORF Transcript_16106/g.15504 Transcript_16106/m.15504 type:complete len:81 (+) Transcript_16106:336-578(+)
MSPSIVTKGYRTVITSVRFRAFLIGGTNSRQNYEFIYDRKVLKERSFMNCKRAYFSSAIKQDKFIYIIGGRGDPSFTNLE